MGIYALDENDGMTMKMKEHQVLYIPKNEKNSLRTGLLGCCVAVCALRCFTNGAASYFSGQHGWGGIGAIDFNLFFNVGNIVDSAETVFIFVYRGEDNAGSTTVCSILRSLTLDNDVKAIKLSKYKFYDSLNAKVFRDGKVYDMDRSVYLACKFECVAMDIDKESKKLEAKYKYNLSSPSKNVNENEVLDYNPDDLIKELAKLDSKYGGTERNVFDKNSKIEKQKKGCCAIQ